MCHHLIGWSSNGYVEYIYFLYLYFQFFLEDKAEEHPRKKVLQTDEVEYEVWTES